MQSKPLLLLSGEIKSPPFTVVIAEVFAKKTQKTPADVIWRCKARLKRYDQERKWL